MRHGSTKRPTMYLASTDIKTVFYVARPKHIANIKGNQDVHGWSTAASLCEMAGLEGQGTFENVDSTFPFARCIRRGSLEPRLWLKMAMQILENVEPEWELRQICSFMWADTCWILSHAKTHLEQMMKDLIVEAER